MSVEGIKVFVDQEVAHFVGEVGRGLPEERGNIVIDGAFATSLEVDEVWLAIFQHDIARLEVTIEKSILLVLEEVIRQTLEVLLQLELIELNSLEFEEAVFEVVEVEHDARLVHRLLGVAMGEECRSLTVAS